jgi:hypothetical protein
MGEKKNQNLGEDQVSSDLAKTVFNASEKEKLDKAHDILQHPDLFAEVFCKVAETQSKVKEIIMAEIRKATENDNDTKKFLKEIIKQVEKEEMWIWGKKIGFAVWTVLILIVGALITKYIK